MTLLISLEFISNEMFLGAIVLVLVVDLEGTTVVVAGVTVVVVLLVVVAVVVLGGDGGG
jgi:hypothetical protein